MKQFKTLALCAVCKPYLAGVVFISGCLIRKGLGKVAGAVTFLYV